MAKKFRISGIDTPNRLLGTDSNGDVIMYRNDGGTGTIRIQGTLDATATSYPQYPAVTGQTGLGRGTLGQILEGDAWLTTGTVVIGAETFEPETLLVSKLNSPTNNTTDWYGLGLGGGSTLPPNILDALQGTSGTPSNTNRYATNDTITGLGSTYQLISEKDQNNGYAGLGVTGNFNQNSDKLTEGSTNLYFTNARARLSVSATTPIQYNNTTGVISIQLANGSQNGYLSSADWTTFNGKLSASGLTTNVVTKWNGTSLANSLIQDNGTTIGVNGSPNANVIANFSSSTLPIGIPQMSSGLSGVPAQAGAIGYDAVGNTFKFGNNSAWIEYLQSFVITRYAKVDYINGNNGTALLQRIDRPYADLQTCYNAIAALSTTDSWIIEVVGDAVFTSSILTRGSVRPNINLVFNCNITSSIPNSSASTGFLPGGWTDSTVTFNGSFTQTTNLGIGIGNLSNSTINFNGKTTLRQAKGAQDNYGIYGTSFVNSSINFKNLIFDFTNDAGVIPYAFLITMSGINSSLNIDLLTIRGSSSLSRSVQMTFGVFNNIYINNVYFEETINYNNISGFTLIGANSVNKLTINNVMQPSATVNPTDFNNFKLLGLDSGKEVYVGNVSLLSIFGLGAITSVDDLQLGCITVSANGGTINSSNVQINGFIRRLVTNNAFISLLIIQGNTHINGGYILDNRTISGGGYNGILHYGSSDNTKTKTISNCRIISNTAVSPNTSKQLMGIEVYGGGASPVRLKLSNVSFVAPLGNTNVNTRPIDSYGGGGFYGIIEGDFTSNYLNLTLPEITINADIYLIPSLQF